MSLRSLHLHDELSSIRVCVDSNHACGNVHLIQIWVPRLLIMALLLCRKKLSVQEALDVTTAQRERVADEDVAEAAYYVKYSYAAYGYLLYVFSKPLYM